MAALGYATRVTVTTAPVLERELAPSPSSEDADPEVAHYYHCDPNVGWCGIDLSEVEESPPKPGEVLCSLCDLAWKSDICPVCG